MSRIHERWGTPADLVTLGAGLLLVGFGIADELAGHHISGFYILAFGIAGALLAGFHLRRRARGEPRFKKDWADRTSPSIRRRVALIGLGILILTIYMLVLAARDFSRGSVLMGLEDLVVAGCGGILLSFPIVAAVRRRKSR